MSDIHLMVVGDAPTDDSRIDCAFMTAETTERFRTVRCPAPQELVDVVDGALEPGERVALLDLFDHGAEGLMNMGEGLLFDSERTGFEIAERLQPFLSETATVRLLGCTTAKGEEGRRLLLGLRHQFGAQRVVVGTLVHIECWAFLPTGFNRMMAPFLFSSTEAEMGVAPPWEERLDLLRTVAGQKSALKVKSQLERIENQLRSRGTDRAECCAR